MYSQANTLTARCLLLSVLLSIFSHYGYAQSPCVAKASLPAVTGTLVNVATVEQLHTAISSLQDNTTLLLAPGTYHLNSTLYITKNNIAIRGDGDTCENVSLVGRGMDNSEYGDVPYGIWTNASGLAVMNLTIQDIYYHGIIYNPGAQTPTINSIHVLDIGQQFVKANPNAYGDGADNGLVENSYFAYTSTVPSTDHGSGVGYTNGIDVHGGRDWVIRANRFENLHMPDSAAWWWNPAILMWNGSANTLVENNLFINVDRAISYGLVQRGEGSDHSGGIIRNNMITYSQNLFSNGRKLDSDAAIIVWDSPSTTVVHNTILTNGNLNKSIEFRFNTEGSVAINNLIDVAMGTRNSGNYSESGTLSTASNDLFVQPSTGNLRLLSTATSAMNRVSTSDHALNDIDGDARSSSSLVDVGADEYQASNRPMPPDNLNVTEL